MTTSRVSPLLFLCQIVVTLSVRCEVRLRVKGRSRGWVARIDFQSSDINVCWRGKIQNTEYILYTREYLWTWWHNLPAIIIINCFLFRTTLISLRNNDNILKGTIRTSLHFFFLYAKNCKEIWISAPCTYMSIVSSPYIHIYLRAKVDEKYPLTSPTLFIISYPTNGFNRSVQYATTCSENF